MLDQSLEKSGQIQISSLTVLKNKPERKLNKLWSH